MFPSLNIIRTTLNFHLYLKSAKCKPSMIVCTFASDPNPSKSSRSNSIGATFPKWGGNVINHSYPPPACFFDVEAWIPGTCHAFLSLCSTKTRGASTGSGCVRIPFQTALVVLTFNIEKKKNSMRYLASKIDYLRDKSVNILSLFCPRTYALYFTAWCDPCFDSKSYNSYCGCTGTMLKRFVIPNVWSTFPMNFNPLVLKHFCFVFVI